MTPETIPGAASVRTLALTIGATVFLMAFDSTAITIALPAMAESFGIESIATSGLLSIYLVAALTTLPLATWLGQRFGLRQTLLLLIAIFGAGSLLNALAPNVEVAMVSRALLGSAGGMMMPVGRLIVLTYLPREEILRAFSVVTIPVVLGPVLGPAIGGLVVSYVSWRWLPLLNFPFALMATVAVLRFIPASRPNRQLRLDVRGALLAGAFLLTLAIALQTGVAAPPLPVALALACCTVLVAYLYRRHAAVTRKAFVDIRLLRLPTFRRITIGVVLARLVTYASPFLISLLFQVGLGFTARTAGLLLLLNAAGSVCAQMTLSQVVCVTGYRRYLLLSSVAVPILFGSTAFLLPATPVALIAALMIAQGFFRSGQMVVASTAAYSEIPASKIGQANTIISVTQQFAGNLGIAVAAAAMAVAVWLPFDGMAPVDRIRCGFVGVSLLAAAAFYFFLRVPPQIGFAPK